MSNAQRRFAVVGLLVGYIVIMGWMALFVRAQGPTTTPRLEWDYQDATIAEVSTYGQVATMDGTRLAVPNCAPKVGAPSVIACWVALPSPLPSGPHTYEVTATAAGVTAGARLENVDLARGPRGVGTLRVTVTTVLTVP